MKEKKILVFSNDNIYKEIDIEEFEKEEVLCGNTNECDIKLRIKTTEEIIITFKKNGNVWSITSDDKIYFIINGIKTPRKQLVHGDTIVTKHNIHRGELFNINYFIDFKSSTENYDLKVYLDKSIENTIGTDKSKDIFIKNELLGNSSFSIKYINNEWVLYDDKTKYGVYINGTKVENKKSIKNNDFITLVGYKFFFRSNELFMSKYDENIIINRLNKTTVQNTNSLYKYPTFLRSPRIMLNYPNNEIEILKPPSKLSKPNTSIVLSMIPLVGTIGLTLTFRLGSTNNSFIYYSIGSVILGATVSLMSIYRNNKQYKDSCLKREISYKEYIKEKTKAIENFIEIQRNNMKSNYPDIDENYKIVTTLQRRLWERSPGHRDFLLTRIGIGMSSPTFDIKVPKREFKDEDDPISELSYEILEKYKVISDMPVMLDIKDAGSIGIVGDLEGKIDFILNTTIDITTHHYNEDVNMLYLFNKKLPDRLKWLKYVPHTWSQDKKHRYISDSKESSHELIKGLYKVLLDRENENKKNNNKSTHFPHYVVYISDVKILENEPIVQFIGKEKNLSVTFIFIYDHIEYLPKECKTIITIGKENRGVIRYTENSDIINEFKYICLKTSQYMDYAKSLSPIYVEESFAESAMPKNISLFDLYNIKTINQISLDKYWSRDTIYKSMAAPLGVKLGNEVVELDLHEKHHGPHGLVAGTTGSGKSEILQSYIASMAINYHPHDVTFIVIDFKGGGMANQFKDLPHMIGAITNIDGNQINRSLKSIDAELKKRQRLFAQFDVNHVDAYMKLYKSKQADTPIPHLIMIVDEFAELKREHPDFMAKLISTARIGRSLGVHLILATQKPAGVVDNQIWSNSKFKLCLRVQNKEDSNEVLKSPLAAEIVDPGRAYLQVGNNEIFELFQSAWSGAKIVEDDEINKNDFEINEININGARKKIFSTRDNENDENNITELDGVINYIDKYCRNNYINKLLGPWLPPLQTNIYLDDINKNKIYSDTDLVKKGSWMSIPIGIYDDPDNQAQGILELDFANKGHLMIVGSPTTGKTTLIQTILTSTMYNHTPEEVNIYILDFGSRILKNFENSPHIGGVITSDEDEKMKNFINFIMQEIIRRKDLFATVGVTSLQSYKEATNEYMPHIMIVIDNFAAMGEYFTGYDDNFNSISREGANLGITLITTSNQTNSIRYKMAANFAQRIALNCNDKIEYSNIIENCKMQPTNVQGRALTSIDKKILEFHIALPVKGAGEIDRAKNHKTFIDELNKNWTGIRAKQIPMMPRILHLSKVRLQDSSLKQDPSNYNISLGLSHDSIDYANISLLDTPILSVAGKNKSGKTNFLNTVAKTLHSNVLKARVEMYLYDSSNYGLSHLREFGSVKQYISTEYEIEMMIDDIYFELEERFDIANKAKLVMGKEFNSNKVLNDKPLILLLVDDADTFTRYISKDKQMMSKFRDIITKFRDLKIAIVVSGAVETFTAIPVVQVAKMIKEENVGLMFEQIANQKMFDFKMSFRSTEKTLDTGDAYFYNKGTYIKVKTPVDDV